MRAARLLSAAAALAALAACSDLHLNPAVSYIETPIADPSWKYDLYPVIAQTCASSHACHLGPNPTTHLDLESDSIAYAQLYNVPSFSRPSAMRVKPGLADSSFVYLVLRDTLSVRLNYPYRMPLTEFVLPYPTRETIKNWINMGAKNN